ncbi:MAG: hypothetical protein WCX65_18660 [bacterium]
MEKKVSKILFDQQDHDLLTIVNDILNRDKSHKDMKNLLVPYLHPHGIKEMAAFKELRIAYAAIHLLNTLEFGAAQDRLGALRSLRDEVLFGAQRSLRRNTARALLQVMKEILRAGNDYDKQLELAHDFRAATTGKPRVIRELLSRYHLLEMPEEWNQIAFDHHVHDSSTKGRKSPTHLIMDAWIKGIRILTVIYYNYVRPEAAEELLRAAEIMGINVRIGIEFPARFRNRYVHFIWTPRGFSDSQDFIDFLAEEPVGAFLEEGRKVSAFKQQHVMDLLGQYNTIHRHVINYRYGLELGELDLEDFLGFVGVGQASITHLAEYIHIKLLKAMEARILDLRAEYENMPPEQRKKTEELVAEMDNLDPKEIVERYLRPTANPTLMDPNIPFDGPDVPLMLKLAPRELMDKLSHLPCGYRITLNLSGLSAEDVLELLYDCEGMITHLEIYNLKDSAGEKPHCYDEINLLRRAINKGNVIELKQIIRAYMKRIEESDYPDREERLRKYLEILRNMKSLQKYGKSAPLDTHIGSDSAGRTHKIHGMGIAIKETLPKRAQKIIARSQSVNDHSYETIPISLTAYLRGTYLPRTSYNPTFNSAFRVIRKIPILRRTGYTLRKDWLADYDTTDMEAKGNLVTLGGMPESTNNGISIKPPKTEHNSSYFSWKNMSTGKKNAIKVLIGFLPAFITFKLTKDWFFLANFGAFIWLGITAGRNIVQSVVGGGGLRQSQLLSWRDYVRWERVADSLLFTGFSVPLLDFLVKTVILDKHFHINTSTNPVALYAVMATVNGLYISTHNYFRGLPREAVIGNLFRTVLSIPLAIALNAALGEIMFLSNVPGYEDVLQKWAAVISKFSSDFVASFIEGAADRNSNIQISLWDYEDKLKQLFETYTRMEIMFPEADMLKMLETPKEFLCEMHEKACELEKILIITALDLLYFWMYRPRARSALNILIRKMTPNEREILVRTQNVLVRNKEISQLFLDGIVGKNFSRALSFYLDRSPDYIAAMKKLA